MRNTCVTIHISNFLHNLGEIRRIVGPRVKISAALKANAYGHGALVMARAAEKGGADFLGVASPAEGAELRGGGIRLPILLYGLALPEEAKIVTENDISASVADEEGLAVFEQAAAACGKKARLHLKIDTGMGRIGCTPQDAPGLARRIAFSSHLVLEGVFTHFPSSDESSPVFTENQIGVFSAAVDAIRKNGADPEIVHASNSGGILQYPAARFSMVRPGIILYGYYPSQDVPRPFTAKPVMELKAPVLFVKKIAAGTTVSYGRGWTAPRETCIATLGAGYADGYPRLLSNKGRVLINGTCYPVVGRVTMDQTMVDLGPQSHVRRGDQAVLFGPDPSGPDAWEIADIAGTIPYEITCGIPLRVRRSIREADFCAE
ncbi:MAG: alanine racemase [Spirochaetales bacterium]|jgi:alanine racemase|nr:alanine racemase [Spirochaetales bacterium]